MAAGATGCAEGDLRENHEQQENHSDNHTDPSNQQDNQQDNQQTNQQDNDTEEPRRHTEIHQLCAAAGSSSDGQIEGLHCFAPHDVSGFEATDGDHTWKPGAFEVVAH